MQMKAEEQTYISVLFVEPAEKTQLDSVSKYSCMWPAGNWSRKVREISLNSFGGTYFEGSVAFKRAVVDLNSASISINGSTLEVACPPPGIGAKFEIVLLAESALIETKSSANES